MSSKALPKIGKRKAVGTLNGSRADDGTAESDASSSSSGSDISFINVDFDFRAPTEADEAALRRLLRQLFHTHANSLNLYDVTRHILELGDTEKTPTSLGTVIKVEGDEDQDPFGFVSAIRLAANDVAASKALTAYLSEHLSASPISAVLTSASLSSSRPYLFLHERFVNLPPQTAPPLYRLLTDELTAATSKDEGQEPTHVLFLSRIFSAEAYSDDEDEPATAARAAAEEQQVDDDHPKGLKGAKRRKGLGGSGVRCSGKPKSSSGRGPRGERLVWGHFRPEDVVLESYATAQETFRFPPPREAEESYESPLYARVLMLEWSKIKGGQIWREMEDRLAAVAAAGGAVLA